MRNLLRRVSIAAAALPLAVLLSGGIIASVVSVPGPLLVGAVFLGPLLACVTGVAYGAMRGAARSAPALVAHGVGLVAFVVGFSWGLVAAGRPGAAQDAAIFTPDILLVGLSFVCALVGAVALWDCDDRPEAAA